ncbi:MAG: GDP-mannose 4,6-dehydratase [Phycisphaerales bacterium]|jgi:UDP-glucose 4-epimerase|nr:GDP-mannose 4,6-dehydratase [Phycisphaerales bacterium]
MAAPDTKPHVLVTGGAGFIGSHLVEHLVASGAHVTVVDDLSTGSLSNLAGATADAGGTLEFIHSDLAGWIESLDSSVRFDRIIHLAAAVGVRLVVDDPIRTIETNIYQTSAVLRLALRHLTPLLLASTSEVYGKGVKSPFSEEDDMTYGPTSRSRWSYACSKAIDEYLALANHKDNGLPVTVVRFFNTVGPRQVGKYGMVLPRFIERALKGEPLEVYGDGLQSRCFIDVRDVVPVLSGLLDNPKCQGRIFNVGNDHPISILELANLVKEVLDSGSEIRIVPYEEAYTEGFEDLKVRVPDLTRIRSEMTFEPVTRLETTIRDISTTIKVGEVSS